MSKYIIRAISLVSTVVLVCTMFTTGFAQEYSLGTDEDISGYILEESPNSNARVITFPEQIGDGGSEFNYPEIFTIEAREVTYLLTSNVGSKDFMLSDIPSSATIMIFKATLHHSFEDYDDGETTWPDLHEKVKFGICKYDYNTVSDEYEYISVYSYYVAEDELGTEIINSFIIDTYLDSSVRYFTYIKNCFHSGHVYGTVGLYYN